MEKILLSLVIFSLLAVPVSAQPISYFRARARDGTIRWFDPLVPKQGPLPDNFESRDHNLLAFVRQRGETYRGRVNFFSKGYLKGEKIIFRRGIGPVTVEVKYPVFMFVRASIDDCETFTSEAVLCHGSGTLSFRGPGLRSRETFENFVLNFHDEVIDLEGGTKSQDDLFSIASMT